MKAHRMISSRRVCFSLVAAAALLALAAPGHAGGGFGQYQVGRYVDYHNIDIWAGNPTSEEMFVLAVVFLEDGSLDTFFGDDFGHDGCNSEVVPAHGGTDEGGFCSGDCDCALPTAAPEGDAACFDVQESPAPTEIIAVPTSGPNQGVFGGDPNLGILTRIGAKKGAMRGAAQDTAFFSLPADSGQAADLVTCACAELAEHGLPDTLLEGAGIVCAAPVGESNLANARVGG